MIDWYQHEIVATGKQPLALLLAAFVVTFLFIRLSVRMIRAGVRWWPGNVTPGGLHVHHVVFGVVVMLVAGAGGFSSISQRTPWAEIFPALFGCGAALVLDEFALILHLRDVYWAEQGRTSVDAVFLAVAVCGLLLLGVVPLGLGDISSEDGWVTEVDLTVTLVVKTALVALTLLKGKYWTGLLGLLVPTFALVGAIRLARPNSPWARWRYRVGSRKQARAIAREDRHHARWVRRRRWLQDALAGGPTAPADRAGGSEG
jgi:hypothetical protein